MAKRILITGLDGFTGRYVAEALRGRGHTVVGTVRKPSDSIVGAIHCDLLDAGHLREIVEKEQPDWVVHLAAIAFVGHSDSGQIYATNIVATRNLLAALAHSTKAPDAVLLASSANVYGNSRSSRPLTEDTPFQPANDYAVSKVAMEYMARLWNDKLPIITVRPFNYIGVGQSSDFLVAKIADHFRRNAETIELGNLDVARDFSDVRWVAQQYCDLLEKAPAGEVFNIASGKAITLNTLIETMADISGYRIQVKVNPAFVRASEVKFLCGDPTRLNSCVGGTSPPTLRATLEWILSS